MSRWRFVLDTNLVISALLLKQSTSRQAFDKALDTGRFLLSLAIIDELDTTLRKEKFNRYLFEQERLDFLSKLVRSATLIEVNVSITDCRDLKDNKFLELAISGTAHCIISGDNDLLVLNPYRSIAILTPRAFIEHQWE